MATCSYCKCSITENNGNGYISEHYPGKTFCSHKCMQEYSLKNKTADSSNSEDSDSIVGALFRSSLIGEFIGEQYDIIKETLDDENTEEEQRHKLLDELQEMQFSENSSQLYDECSTLLAKLKVCEETKEKSFFAASPSEWEKKYSAAVKAKYEQGLKKMKILAIEDAKAKLYYDELMAEVAAQEREQKAHEEKEKEQKEQRAKNKKRNLFLFLGGIVSLFIGCITKGDISWGFAIVGVLLILTTIGIVGFNVLKVVFKEVFK